MRAYHQYCSIAKALDVVGERWTLLIVRELLTRGPCRYTDLRNGLPGIATNLLATRLQELAAAGLIQREQAPPPIATTLYTLTPRGRALEPVIDELGRWGMPLMRIRDDQDVFKGHWLQLPVKRFLSDKTPGGPPIQIQIEAGGEHRFLDIHGSIALRAGRAPRPDTSIAGTPQLVLALFAGTLTLDEAVGKGLVHTGSRQALERILPTGSQRMDADLDDARATGRFTRG
jgi:DNA-binding HxlR family transcriptional regulator